MFAYHPTISQWTAEEMNGRQSAKTRHLFGWVEKRCWHCGEWFETKTMWHSSEGAPFRTEARIFCKSCLAAYDFHQRQLLPCPYKHPVERPKVPM